MKISSKLHFRVTIHHELMESVVTLTSKWAKDMEAYTYMVHIIVALKDQLSKGHVSIGVHCCNLNVQLSKVHGGIHVHGVHYHYFRIRTWIGNYIHVNQWYVIIIHVITSPEILTVMSFPCCSPNSHVAGRWLPAESGVWNPVVSGWRPVHGCSLCSQGVPPAGVDGGLLGTSAVPGPTWQPGENT